MSLRGCRVVVTRAHHQVEQLVARLEDIGAVPVVMPVIDIVDPDDQGAALRSALARIEEFDWVVVTSVNTVQRLTGALPESTRVAAIGTATAERLQHMGWRVDLVPPQFVAESLVDSFPSGSGRVLLPRAAVARDVLPDGLRSKGWAVEVVDAYKTVEVVPDADVLQQALSADFVTFAAPSAVRAFVNAAGGRKPAGRVVCIGPVTEAAAVEAGFEPKGVASTHTIEGLVSELSTLSD